MTRYAALPVFCAVLAVSHAAHAQQSPEAEAAQRAVAKAQALLRQVAAEKQALQTENLKLQTDLKKTEKKLKSTERKLEETEATLEEAEASNTALAQQLSGTQARLERTEDTLSDTTERLRETSVTLQVTSQRKEQLTVDTASTYDAQTQALLECEAKNVQLYEANRELLDRYASKGAWDSILQAEAFTGIRQVEVENILQEYRFKLEDESFKRPPIARPESLERELEALEQAAGVPPEPAPTDPASAAP